MARKKDPNSVRQQAFKFLNQIKKYGWKRERIIDDLKERFNIGDAYAATLYASHREMAKKSGNLITVYSVRDHKDGKPVVPYLRTEYVFRAPKNAATKPEDAIKQYLSDLEAKESAAIDMLNSL